MIRPIRIVIDTLPNPDTCPLLIQRKDEVTLLVEHRGTSAEDIIPRFLTDMTMPEQRYFFPVFGVDEPPEVIRADWKRHLGHLLWMRCLSHLIPHQVKWE